MTNEHFKDIPRTLLQEEALLTLAEPVLVYQSDDGKSINVVYPLHGKVVDINGCISSLALDEDEFSSPPPPTVFKKKEAIFKEKKPRKKRTVDQVKRSGAPAETYRVA